MRQNRWLYILLGLVAVVCVGLYVRSRTAGLGGGRGPGAPAGSASAGLDARPVPVVVAQVTERDVPIYLDGLGSVTALSSVNIRSQVDGRLDRVLFKEGQQVKKGEQIAQIDPRPFAIQLHSAEAAIARDRAQSRNGRVNLERYTTLRGQNLVAQQQVDDQKAQVDQAEATVMLDQAQADSARLMLDYANIRSPIDGVTGVRLVDPGNVIHPADPTGIVVITQLDPIAVLFTLPEDDLPRVARRMAEGPVSVEAWSRDGATKIATGAVTLVDNQINQATATIKLKAVFENPDHALWPNQFIKARLLLATKKGAVVVPATVVQRGPQGSFAYLVGPDQRVSMKPVVVDLLQGELAVLSSGLAPGDRVVVDGQNQLRPGSKIIPKSGEPPSPQAGGPGGPSPPDGAPGSEGRAGPGAAASGGRPSPGAGAGGPPSPSAGRPRGARP